MTKLLNSIFLTLLLSACGTQASNTEKDINSSTATTPKVKEIQEKAVEKKVSTVTEKVEKTVPKAKEETPKVKKEEANATTATQEKAVAKTIFTLKTLDGSLLHVDEVEEGIIFQEHKGKVVFLLFFGYRCPPCLAEIPTLKAMTAKGHDDFEIIAIEVQRLPSEQLKAFKKSKGINYTLLSGELKENYQFISYVGQRAQWGGSIPFLVALNPKGAVKVVHVGGIGPKEFNAIYDKIKLEK